LVSSLDTKAFDNGKSDRLTVFSADVIWHFCSTGKAMEIMKRRIVMVALGLLVAPSRPGLQLIAASGRPGRDTGGAWADTGWIFPFVEAFNTALGQHFSTSPQG